MNEFGSQIIINEFNNMMSELVWFRDKLTFTLFGVLEQGPLAFVKRTFF